MWLDFPIGLWGMTLVRACAGIGQAMILIGVQTYILKVVPPEKKTQGAAVIVFGFQAGLIAGMGLGSLLVNSLQAEGVFVVSGVIALATLLYTSGVVPELPTQQSKTKLSAAIKKIALDIKTVAKSFEFINTLLCIGVPAKAVLTGVVTFSIPLVLAQYGFRSEDIGQIVMLYGLGVLASSGYVSRLVDRTKKTGAVLITGAVVSGVGLSVVGLLGSPWFGDGAIATATIAAAVALVGVAHGCINAPVMTHVAQSNLAAQLGSTQVLTVYRFVERGGHVAGPIVLSQLFLLVGQGPHVIGAVGAVLAILGGLFFANGVLMSRRSSAVGAIP
jgi:predicted MFS family arabinose efflux permease